MTLMLLVLRKGYGPNGIKTENSDLMWVKKIKKGHQSRKTKQILFPSKKFCCQDKEFKTFMWKVS